MIGLIYAICKISDKTASDTNRMRFMWIFAFS